jgi:hypothetical protein
MACAFSGAEKVAELVEVKGLFVKAAVVELRLECRTQAWSALKKEIVSGAREELKSWFEDVVRWLHRHSFEKDEIE